MRTCREDPALAGRTSEHYLSRNARLEMRGGRAVGAFRPFIFSLLSSYFVSGARSRDAAAGMKRVLCVCVPRALFICRWALNKWTDGEEEKSERRRGGAPSSEEPLAAIFVA